MGQNARSGTTGPIKSDMATNQPSAFRDPVDSRRACAQNLALEREAITRNLRDAGLRGGPNPRVGSLRV